MAGSSGPARSADNSRVDLIATIVMAVAAILTAWAAFQSAKWSGIQAIEFSRANGDRVESTRLDDRANQLRAIDVDLFLTWLEELEMERRAGEVELRPEEGYQPTEGTLSAFYFARMRDEFKPALDAWLASSPLTDPDAARTPFEMKEYVLADAERARQLREEASQRSDAARTANRNSDNHVLTAVALALVIFFAGVSSKIESWRSQRVLVTSSIVVLAGAGVVLVILPKVPPF